MQGSGEKRAPTRVKTNEVCMIIKEKKRKFKSRLEQSIEHVNYQWPTVDLLKDGQMYYDDMPNCI